jgi:hypothetical protein
LFGHILTNESRRRIDRQLERHLAIGGRDRPAEALLSFLFRFGNIGNCSKISVHTQTLIGKRSIVKCDHGVAELEPVFKIEHCCEMFQACWNRLSSYLRSNVREQNSFSYLGGLVFVDLLKQEREAHLSKAASLHQYTLTHKNHSWIPFLGNARRIVKEATRKRKRADEDATAEELMAGYGVKRGPHGDLTPKSHPDRRESRPTGIMDMVRRAQKNRKNKKKQKRDEGIVAIAKRVERFA